VILFALPLVAETKIEEKRRGRKLKLEYRVPEIRYGDAGRMSMA